MSLLCRARPRSSAPAVLTLCIFALTLFFTGCDSSGDDPDPQRTEFLVRYELTGTCNGIQVFAYNVTTGGGTNGSSGTFTPPWSFEHTVSAPTSPTATAISATCQGANGAPQSLTGRILVDGVERAAQTNEGSNQISVTLSVLLR